MNPDKYYCFCARRPKAWGTHLDCLQGSARFQPCRANDGKSRSRTGGDTPMPMSTVPLPRFTVLFQWMTAFVVGALLALPAPAMSVVPPTFSELVNKSDYVVRTVVKS